MAFEELGSAIFEFVFSGQALFGATAAFLTKSYWDYKFENYKQTQKYYEKIIEKRIEAYETCYSILEPLVVLDLHNGYEVLALLNDNHQSVIERLTESFNSLKIVRAWLSDDVANSVAVAVQSAMDISYKRDMTTSNQKADETANFLFLCIEAFSELDEEFIKMDKVKPYIKQRKRTRKKQAKELKQKRKSLLWSSLPPKRPR